MKSTSAVVLYVSSSMTTMVCFVGSRLISDLVNNEGDHFFLRLVCIDFTINNFSVDSNEFVPDSAGSTKSRAEFHEDCRIWFVIQMFHRGKELLTKFCFFLFMARFGPSEISHTTDVQTFNESGSWF